MYTLVGPPGGVGGGGGVGTPMIIRPQPTEALSTLGQRFLRYNLMPSNLIFAWVANGTQGQYGRHVLGVCF